MQVKQEISLFCRALIQLMVHLMITRDNVNYIYEH